MNSEIFKTSEDIFNHLSIEDQNRINMLVEGKVREVIFLGFNGVDLSNAESVNSHKSQVINVIKMAIVNYYLTPNDRPPRRISLHEPIIDLVHELSDSGLERYLEADKGKSLGESHLAQLLLAEAEEQIFLKTQPNK
jgi:hypothetical protein